MKNTGITKETLSKYFSEIIVIFLGISISFWFDEWRDNRKDREIEQKILLNLRENLVQDTIMLGNQAKLGESMEYSINQLLSLKNDISADSLNYFIDAASSYMICLNNQTTYEEIKQTGQSRLIQNDSLKNDILVHYTIFVPYIKEWCEVSKTQTMTQLIPELNNYFPVVIDSFSTISVNEKKVALKKIKIRNLLLTDMTYKKATVMATHMVKNKSKKLIEKIDKALKK